MTPQLEGAAIIIALVSLIGFVYLIQTKPVKMALSFLGHVIGVVCAVAFVLILLCVIAFLLATKP